MVTLLQLQQEGTEVFQPSLLLILLVLGPSVRCTCNSDPVNSYFNVLLSLTLS